MPLQRSRKKSTKNTEKQNPILLISEVQSLMDKLALWDNPNSLDIRKGEEYSREQLLLNLSSISLVSNNFISSTQSSKKTILEGIVACTGKTSSIENSFGEFIL